MKRSTLYVNLEPCSHYGKTPPCADFIISNSIPRVVVGAVDTSSKVSGAGIRKLRAAGVEVVTGVLENESRWLNRRFFISNEERRPWIILKWAKSRDGYIDVERDTESGSGPTWISGNPERVLVHRWRSFEQAILVGAGTVRTDNPKLNVREWKGNNPLVVILSASGQLSAGSIEGRMKIFTNNKEASVPGAEMVLLREDEPACKQVAAHLYNSGIQSLFIEGGASILNHFIMNNLWDEARIFTGKNDFSGGVVSPDIKGFMIAGHDFQGSKLQIYLNEEVKDLYLKIKS